MFVVNHCVRLKNSLAFPVFSFQFFLVIDGSGHFTDAFPTSLWMVT